MNALQNMPVWACIATSIALGNFMLKRACACPANITKKLEMWWARGMYHAV